MCIVADELLRLFHDADGGEFFTTGHDAEALVVRPKDVFDDATPSANALAANALLRLAALTGDDRYARAGGCDPRMLCGPDDVTSDGLRLSARRDRASRARPIEVVIVGDPTDERTHALARRGRGPARARVGHAHRARRRRRVAASRRPGGPLRDVPTAYVCEHYACRAPVTTPEELRAQIDAALAAR